METERVSFRFLWPHCDPLQWADGCAVQYYNELGGFYISTLQYDYVDISFWLDVGGFCLVSMAPCQHILLHILSASSGGDAE